MDFYEYLPDDFKQNLPDEFKLKIDISNIKNLNSEIKGGVKESKGEDTPTSSDEEETNIILKKAEAQFSKQDRNLREQLNIQNERVKTKMLQLQGMVEQQVKIKRLMKRNMKVERSIRKRMLQ